MLTFDAGAPVCMGPQCADKADAGIRAARAKAAQMLALRASRHAAKALAAKPSPMLATPTPPTPAVFLNALTIYAQMNAKPTAETRVSKLPAPPPPTPETLDATSIYARLNKGIAQ